MKTRKTLLTLLAISLLFLLHLQNQTIHIQVAKAAEPNGNSPSTIYVPDNYSTIQEAINAASPGDTIIVGEGTYYENLVVNVSGIVLRSEMGAEKTIIDGNSTGTVVEISADNVTIEGFTIRGGNTGLYIHSSNNTLHENNIVNNNYDGIYLYYSSNNTIYGNNITNNGDDGIFLRGSSSNVISGNNITNNYAGIHLYSSSNNTISGSKIANNKRGIYLYYSSSNVISGNNITNNVDAGIDFSDSSNNTIVGNNITNNDGNGIYLYYSSNNTIYGNNIANNYGHGVYLGGSGGCNVSFNIFVNDGLSVDDSFDNFVVEGNLVNGKPLVYLEDAANVEVADAGQIIAVNSRNITVRNLEISYTDVAIEFWNTNESKIENCNLNNNAYGIVLLYSIGCNVSGNNMVNNSLCGVYLGFSYNNTIVGNNMVNNSLCGIALWDSSNTVISGNNITNNSGNIPDDWELEWAGIVLLESSDNNTIVGNNIANNYWHGVYLEGSDNNTIVGNNMVNNSYCGIKLEYSDNNTISENNITNNNKILLHYDILAGILLEYSYNNAIYGNNVTSNYWDGIYLYSSSSNAIYGNNVTNNDIWGIDLWYSGGCNVSFNIFVNDGLRVYDSYGNFVEGNLVNGKPLVYLENAENIEVTNAGQIIAVNSRNITIKNLEISYTDVAIEFWNTNESKIENCNITNNGGGIYLEYSYNNTVVGNNITNNDIWGIYLLYSYNNTIVGNNIVNNSYCGIALWGSSNVVYLNNFISNGRHSFSWLGNVWWSPSPLDYIYNNVSFTGYLGNYWDDYAGSDSDGDGVGDTPYQIDSENVDNYPLMEPVENYVFDVTPPTLQVESPMNNSFVRGVVNISVSAHDQYGVSKVEFYVDGELAATDNVAPYTWNWNTTKSSDGAHTIEIKVYDAFNNVNSTKIIVNVDNTPPSLDIVSPASGSWVGTYVFVNVSVSDELSGIQFIELLINGSSQGYYYPQNYNVCWNATEYAEGTYNLTVVAYDNVNNTASASIIVHLDKTPPTINVTSPANESC